MKKLSYVIAVLLLLSLAMPLSSQGTKDVAGDSVMLTMGSWRTDDVEQMNRLLAAYKKLLRMCR